MIKNKIKTIIFDFDGVIANTISFTLKETVNFFKKNFQTNFSDRQMIKIIRTSNFKDVIDKFKIPFFKLPVIFWEIKKSQRKLNKIIDKIKVFSGIKKLLKILKKKYQLVIISSNSKKNIEDFLKAKKISFFDDVIAGSYILDKSKVISNFLKKRKLKKDEVIFVADEARDVIACKKVGIKVIAVSWGLQEEKILKKYNPDYIIKKPLEILKIVC